MKMIKTMTALAFLWAMVSCSPMKVVVEMKNPTDFSQYTTYSFLGWQNESGDILSEEDKGYLREAFTREFDRRGLTRVNSGGDMEISLFIVTSQETAVSGYNDYVGRGYGAYSYYGGGYGYGTSNNTYKIRSKLVGTLIMDVYDGKSKNQVWQAIATGVVEKNPQKRSRTIPASIATFMREFPVKVK